MEVILLGNIGLDNSTDAFVKISQYLEQILELLVDPADKVSHLISLGVIVGGSLKAVLQEFDHVDGVVILVRPADG